MTTATANLVTLSEREKVRATKMALAARRAHGGAEGAMRVLTDYFGRHDPTDRGQIATILAAMEILEVMDLVEDVKRGLRA